MNAVKNLIYSRDNSIEPNGAIARQKSGIIFWQKTGFLRHCNQLGFQSMIMLITKKFAPTAVHTGENMCFIQFDNDDKKTIFLSLKKERNPKHFFIYGESHTAYVNADFHVFALEVVSYIAKNIGCRFYVDDATGFLEHGSRKQLEQYIDNTEFAPVVSDDLLRKSIIEHQNRPLDIHEILSREDEENVVVDAYEFFMRQSGWKIDDRFNDTIQNFLYCVQYDGFVGNGGISFFLIDNNAACAHRTADALHYIGDYESETLLRRGFELFPDGIIPQDETGRAILLEKLCDDFAQLDADAYNSAVDSFCYRYLMDNKKYFMPE